MAQNDRLALSVLEAAELAGLSRTFLYEAMRDGQLRSVRAGGRRLILRVDLEAYLNSLHEAA